MKLSPFTIYLIIVTIAVYAIWFIFFQDVIQFILENALSLEFFTPWIGIFFLPFLGVLAVLGITTLILYMREKMKAKK